MRPLGFSESFFHFMHGLGAFVICVGARLRGPMTEERLSAALARAQRRHPLLRAHVVDERGVYHFRESGTGAIPLRTIARESAATFERAMEDEIARPIAGSPAPRLRALFIAAAPPDDAFEIIIAMDHAVCDGASVISLFRDILGDAARSFEGAEPPPAPPLPLLPSLEALLAARGPLPKWKAKPEKSEVPLLASRPPRGPRKTRLFFRDLDAAETERLSARCRAESTSVNGALTAAALLAMQKLAGSRARVSVISNVSLRGQAEPPVGNDAVGNFVSYVQTYHDVSRDMSLWDLARTCRDAISAQVEAREAEGRLALGQLVWWQRGFLRHIAPRIKHGIGNALAVSNSGRLGLDPKQGPFEVHAVYAASSQHVLGSTIALFVWSIAGAMHVCVGYPEPLVDRETASKVADEMMRLLRDT